MRGILLLLKHQLQLKRCDSSEISGKQRSSDDTTTERYFL